MKFDTEELKALVSEAIMQSLDAQKRDALIRDAIQYLLTPKDGGYGRVSPLQEVFREAIRGVTRDVCEEVINQDLAVREQIRSLIVAAVEKMIGEKREELISNMSRNLASWMTANS